MNTSSEHEHELGGKNETLHTDSTTRMAIDTAVLAEFPPAWGQLDPHKSPEDKSPLYRRENLDQETKNTVLETAHGRTRFWIQAQKLGLRM